MERVYAAPPICVDVALGLINPLAVQTLIFCAARVRVGHGASDDEVMPAVDGHRFGAVEDRYLSGRMALGLRRYRAAPRVSRRVAARSAHHRQPATSRPRTPREYG